jgi:hypothetical protein
MRSSIGWANITAGLLLIARPLVASAPAILRPVFELGQNEQPRAAF